MSLKETAREPFSGGEHAEFWNLVFKVLQHDERMSGFSLSSGHLESNRSFFFHLRNERGTIDLIADKQVPGHVRVCVVGDIWFDETMLLTQVLQSIFERFSCASIDVEWVDVDQCYDLVS